jgi:hypothetical protein
MLSESFLRSKWYLKLDHILSELFLWNFPCCMRKKYYCYFSISFISFSLKPVASMI